MSTTITKTGDITVAVTIANGAFLTTEDGTPLVSEANNYIIGEHDVKVTVTLDPQANNATV